MPLLLLFFLLSVSSNAVVTEVKATPPRVLLLIYRGAKPEPLTIDRTMPDQLQEKLGQLSGHEVEVVALPAFQNSTWVHKTLPELIEHYHVNHVLFFLDWSKSVVIMGAAEYLMQHGYPEQAVALAALPFYQANSENLAGNFYFQLGSIGFSRRVPERTDPLRSVLQPMESFLEDMDSVTKERNAKFTFVWPGMPLLPQMWRDERLSGSLRVLSLMEPMKYTFYMSPEPLTKVMQNLTRVHLETDLDLRDDVYANDPLAPRDDAYLARQHRIAERLARVAAKLNASTPF